MEPEMEVGLLEQEEEEVLGMTTVQSHEVQRKPVTQTRWKSDDIGLHSEAGAV